MDYPFAGNLGSIPGLGRSSGEGKGYPLQYSGLENSMDYSLWSCKESYMTERLSLSLLSNSEAAMNQRKQNTGIWLWTVQELIMSIALHKLYVLGSVYLLESHVKSHDQTKCAWSEILAILITKDMLWYILFIRNTLLCFTCIFPGKRNET